MKNFILSKRHKIHLYIIILYYILFKNKKKI